MKTVRSSQFAVRSSQLSTFLFAFLSIFLVSIPTSFAQECHNATHVAPQMSFDWHEENGQAFVVFVPNTTKVSLGVSWQLGSPIPASYALLEGSCGSFATIDSGYVFDPGDEMLYFTYDSLTPGSTYYFKFVDTPGSGFLLNGGISFFSIQPPGTCVGTTCNLVQNPGFEQAELNYTTSNPVGNYINPTNFSLIAFADQACGWDLPIGNGNTPDYFLAPLNQLYSSIWPNCTTSAATGNVCPGNAHNSNGVMHLFSIDTRPNFNRREYIYTQLNSNISPNGNYYVSLACRVSPYRQKKSSALQFLFVNQNTINSNPITNNQPITSWGLPEVDFSSNIDINNSSWQTVSTIFKKTGTNEEFLVIGNFLDNNQTAPFLSSNATINYTNPLDNIPALWLDDIEIIELPNAGDDIVLCQPGQVLLGSALPCLPYPDPITIEWFNDATGQYLGSQLPLSTIITIPGTATYRLTITYNGQVFNDFVTVKLAPTIGVDVVKDNNCYDGSTTNAEYYINGLLPGTTLSLSSPNVTWSNYSTSNGNLVIVNPVVNATNGHGTLYLTGSYNYNGITCTINETFYIYDCCKNAKKVDLTFAPGSNMSTQLAPLGNIISNMNFQIVGNVIIDDNYSFNDCHFYFMPDASLTVNSGLWINVNNTTFEPCGNYRWDEILVQSDAYFNMNESYVKGAIRGIHVTDNSALYVEANTFENNYNSIFIDNYLGGPFLDIYGNTFICEGIGHAGIIQHPNSTVPFANPQYNYVTGIVLNQSANIAIGNSGFDPNTFTTSSPTNTYVKSELSYINSFYSTNSSLVNNHFGFAYAAIWASHSDFTIGGPGPNQPNSFNPTLYSPGAMSYTGNGVLANACYGIVENNIFDQIGNAATFTNLKLQSPTFGATQILNNTINAYWGLGFFQPKTTGSRIRIIGNDITAKSRGIHITDYVECDTQPDRIFINDNTITMAAPLGSNPFCKGIDLLNTNCVTIGDNVILGSATYTPPGSHINVVGIHLNQSSGCRVSRNDISHFNYGLLMDNEAGTTDYSCMNFNTCYTSVLYKDITANFVRPVTNFYPAIGSTGAASGNTFVNNLNGAGRVDAQGTLNVNVLSEYHYDGIVSGIEDPKLTTSTSLYLLILKDKQTGICDNLPSSKTENESIVNDAISIKIYPNPSSSGRFTFLCNTTFNSGRMSVYNGTGTLVQKVELTSQEIVFEIAPISGLYFLKIEIDNKMYYEKVVVSGN